MDAELPSFATHAQPTQDLQAYELYLQAVSLLSRGDAEDVHVAQRLAQQAIARDPEFARAQYALALSHVNAAFFGLTSDTGAELDRSEQAALRALELDSSLLPVRVLLALVNSYRGAWVPAREVFESVLSLSDSEPGVHQAYALFLATAGHTRQALQQSDMARRLAPGGGAYASLASIVRSIIGLDAEALRYAELAVNLGIPREALGPQLTYENAASRRGDFAAAAVHMVNALPAEVREARGADTVRMIYAALADPGKKTAALQALRDLQANGPGMDSGVMLIFAMNWYTELGALDDAYAVAEAGLARLQRTGAIGGNWAGMWLPEMRPFRQDPRFQTFAQRLGLMEYWKEYGAPDNCEFRDGKLICH
jgi:tetratricopeptide (TPR) repeat protein